MLGLPSCNKLWIAVPAQPLNDVVLSDADEPSALLYLKQNLKDLGMDHAFSQDEVQVLQRLGGRVRDLETVKLIHTRHLLVV